MKANHQERLIARAIQGRAEAFASLYQRYNNAAYRYFYFHTGNPAIAEQLTDRLFLRIWEALPLDPELTKLPFVLWLLRHAQVVVTEYNSLLGALDLPAQRPPLVAWSAQTTSADLPKLNPGYLARAVRQLKVLEQQVVVLRFMLGLSHKDTALVIGDTEEGVTVLQYRALLSLQEVVTRRAAAASAFALPEVTTASFCIDRIIDDTASIESSLENVPNPSPELRYLLQFAVMVIRARRIAARRDFEHGSRQRIVHLLATSIRPPVTSSRDSGLNRLRARIASWLGELLGREVQSNGEVKTDNIVD